MYIFSGHARPAAAQPATYPKHGAAANAGPGSRAQGADCDFWCSADFLLRARRPATPAGTWDGYRL